MFKLPLQVLFLSILFNTNVVCGLCSDFGVDGDFSFLIVANSTQSTY